MISEPTYITSMNTNSIFAIAGYYTDFDGLQHVIAGTKDGNVYEVHWNQPTSTTVRNLADNFGTSLVNIAGFFTPDDNFHHAVGITSDSTLHELYFSLDESPNLNNLHYHIESFDPSKGAASFYSPVDNLRHVVVVDRNGNPVDITWNGQQAPKDIRITIPLTISQVASISGFLSTDENPDSRHIIVARKDTGQIYDIAYSDELHVPNDTSGQGQVTSLNEPVKNVTAFFSSDDNYRHIVVLTQANKLKDHAYDTQGNTTSTILTTSALPDVVVDITSYFTPYDGLRHVIYATPDGSLKEITFTSQG
jgi:hypothetical protein